MHSIQIPNDYIAIGVVFFAVSFEAVCFLAASLATAFFLAVSVCRLFLLTFKAVAFFGALLSVLALIDLPRIFFEAAIDVVSLLTTLLWLVNLIADGAVVDLESVW